MEKTVSINLGGLVFHIEAPAYQALEQYLENVKAQLSKSANAGEVMEDVENRLAELFEARLFNRKEVITQQDVEHVKKEMGAPETFADEMASDQPQDDPSKHAESGSTFISRNIENGIIGGVCSGVGEHYDFDPVWLRLAFVAAVLIFGSGILVYLALWIVLPAKKKCYSRQTVTNNARANQTKNSLLSQTRQLVYQLLAGVEWILQQLVKACRRVTHHLQHHS